MVLSDLIPGQAGIIQGITAEGILLQRLFDLGLLPGTQIKALYLACGGDPVAYAVRGTVLALRRSTACKVTIQPLGRLSDV